MQDTKVDEPTEAPHTELAPELQSSGSEPMPPKASVGKSGAGDKEPVPTARSSEVTAGLSLAVAGLLSFWGAWSIYNQSIEAKHSNYFSHAAWLFMVSFVLVTLSALWLIRNERPWMLGLPKDTVTASGKPKVERNGLVLGLLIYLPFYAIFWFKAWEVWQAVYTEGGWPKAVFFVLFAAISYGVYYALRPPSLRDEAAERMPTRQVLLLMMVPFGLVFGMIWLASLYPPWP